MFKHHSLKNQKRLLNFDFIFAIYIKYNAFSKKRSASYLKYLGRYSPQGMWLLECPKAPVLENLSGVNVFTGAKHCLNQQHRISY